MDWDPSMIGDSPFLSLCLGTYKSCFPAWLGVTQLSLSGKSLIFPRTAENSIPSSPATMINSPQVPPVCSGSPTVNKVRPSAY